MMNVLYIHGMGGGGDSRIPSILAGVLEDKGIRIVVRTYDFDPETASLQIFRWVEEIQPVLVIGESLGALHAMRIAGIPHILISPALNSPIYFELLAWLSLIPGVTSFFDWYYRPKQGDRQRLHFTFTTLRKYMSHRSAALSNSTLKGSDDIFFAFFGHKDHYRKSGIVSVKTWKKYYGDAFHIYEGSHFMEETHVRDTLVSKIMEILNINK